MSTEIETGEKRETQGEQPSSQPATELSDCEDCGGMFECHSVTAYGATIFRQRYCPACTAKISAAQPAEKDEWKEICPPSYHATDIDRLIAEGKANMSKVKGGKIAGRVSVPDFLATPFSSQGINLIGPPRLGKTRIMFKLLERYFREDKQYVRYIYAPTFSDELAARWGDSPSKANDWVKMFIRTRAWFLDDLGKGKLSERAQSTILRIIEERTANLRPCYITSNATGADLIKKMSNEDGEPSDNAEPMIERIREFCTPYVFTAKP